MNAKILAFINFFKQEKTSNRNGFSEGSNFHRSGSKYGIIALHHTDKNRDFKIPISIKCNKTQNQNKFYMNIQYEILKLDK